MDLSRQRHQRYYVANCMVNERGEFQPPFHFYADSRKEALELIRREFVPRGIKPAADGRSYLTELSLERVDRELKDLSYRVAKSQSIFFTRLSPDLTRQSWKSPDQFFAGRTVKGRDK